MRNARTCHTPKPSAEASRAPSSALGAMTAWRGRMEARAELHVITPPAAMQKSAGPSRFRS